MYKNLFYSIVGLSLIFGLSSCGDKPKNGRTDTYSSGNIQFTCDESFHPIIDEEIEVFESIYRNAHVTPIYTDELEAVNLLLSDSVCLAIASHDFTKQQYDNFKSRGHQPKAIPLAKDGLALIINNQNTDSCISVKDVKRVLSGEAKNWSDIYPGSKRGEIVVCFDNKQSSTVHFCVDSLLGGKPINSPNIVATKTSKEVIQYVQDTPNAIGILGSNWLNDPRDTTNITFYNNTRVMHDQAYIYNGRYPIVRTVYALLNDPRRGLPWGFAHFIESYKGQLIIKKSGILPIIMDTYVIDVKVNQ